MLLTRAINWPLGTNRVPDLTERNWICKLFARILPASKNKSNIARRRRRRGLPQTFRHAAPRFLLSRASLENGSFEKGKKKKNTKKTWQWPTASRNEPDSWTTLYSTCALSLSSSLIPSYPLRFWDVLFSTNLSAVLHPVCWCPCLRGTPTNAESLARLAWLVSTVPAWSEHMPPALLLYAHSKQIRTISRRCATRSAILVLAADCVWHRGWDETLIKKRGLILHDGRVAQVSKPGIDILALNGFCVNSPVRDNFSPFRNGLVSHLLRTLLTARCSCLSTQ